MTTTFKMFMDEDKVIVNCSLCQKVTLSSSGYCHDCYIVVNDDSMTITMEGIKKFFTKIYHFFVPSTSLQESKIKGE